VTDCYQSRSLITNHFGSLGIDFEFIDAVRDFLKLKSLRKPPALKQAKLPYDGFWCLFTSGLRIQLKHANLPSVVAGHGEIPQRHHKNGGLRT
jgi:hypothetical protein